MRPNIIRRSVAVGSLIALVALFVGAVSAGRVTQSASEDRAREAQWFLAEALSDLELSAEQRSAIDRIRRSNEAWLETLRQDFALARAASLSTIGPDFVRPETGRRFQLQGEAAAFLWGNQARVTNEVAAVLDAEQREILLADVQASADRAPDLLAPRIAIVAVEGGER